MRNIFLLLAALVSFRQEGYAQEHSIPRGGGGYDPPKAVCISDAERAGIDRMLQQNRQYLIKEGKLAENGGQKPTAVSFIWPLKQAAGYNYYSYYGISNFVDHNSGYPNQWQDWNCGTRTYDLANGYNHAGVDIFLWPFDMNMMADMQVEIIAAEAGTIIGKTDGNFDKNCAMGSGNWNAVYVEHSDGTVTWYGHMKNGSLTTKGLGASVAKGEFLGTVGSSGSSTGPHLHFEVHDNASTVLDPYTGTCNSAATMWTMQKPYYESMVNTLMTHHAAPVMKPCPQPHEINRRDTFSSGQTAYFAAYYHDQRSGQSSTYKILKPDNSVWKTWTHASSTPHYAASWWYWSHALPGNGPYGKWRFTVDFEGNNYTHDFYVKDPLAISGITAENEPGFYPNPAKDFLFVSHRDRINTTRLYNISGQAITDVTWNNDRLDLRSLPDGIYFLHAVLKDGHVLHQRIAVQH